MASRSSEHRLRLEQLEDRITPAGPSFTNLPVLPQGQTLGTISVSDEFDTFAVSPSTVNVLGPGQIRLRVAAAPNSALDPRLTFYDFQGSIIGRSDDVSLSDKSAELTLILPVNTYFVAVSGQTLTSVGDYQLTMSFIGQSALMTNYLTIEGTVNHAQSLDVNRDGANEIVAVGNADLTVLFNTGSGVFAPGKAFSTFGNRSSTIRTADIDGDGNLDVIATNFASANVGIAYGTGNGAFSYRAFLPTGVNPGDFDIGDLNSDGLLDLVVACDDEQGLYVFFGTPSGRFGAPVIPAFEPALSSVRVGDVNNDGKADLILGGQGGLGGSFEGVRVYLGDGNGNFAPQPTINLGVRTWRLDYADVNGDTIRDLIVGQDGQISVLLGTGAGFAAPLVQALPFAAKRLGTGDFNGDGKIDLAAIVGADGFSQSVNIFLGNGDGTFGMPSSLALSGRFGPGSLQVIDADGDGKLDILATTDTRDNDSFNPPGAVQLFLGKGDGTFTQTPVPSIPANPANRYQAAFLTDITNDGRLDFLVSNPLGLQLFVGEPSVGLPTFSLAIAPWSAGYFNGVRATQVADLNNDGVDDLLVVSEPWLSIFLGDGRGSFRVGYQILAPTIADATLGYFDTDTFLDIAFVDQATKSLRILNNNRDGSFRLGVVIPTTLDTVNTLATGDFNGDLRPDIAVAGRGATGSVQIFQGDGKGNFAFTKGFAPNDLITEMTAADLNFDGRSDLIYVDAQDNLVTVFGGRFTMPLVYPSGLSLGGASGASLTLADVNGDGLRDVLLASPNNSAVYVRPLLPGGLLGEAMSVAFSSAAVNNVAVIDLNDDGVLDLIAGGKLSVGTALSIDFKRFLTTQRVLTPVTPSQILTSDLDRDGRTDAIVLGQRGSAAGDLTIFRGQGDGTFEPLQVITAPELAAPAKLVLADFNRDARADIVFIRSTGLTFFPGLGDGKFAPGVKLTNLPGGVEGVAADFDGDGLNDLVYADGVFVRLARGLGDGNFAEPIAIAAGVDPDRVRLGDFNGDGRPDLAAISKIGTALPTLAILLNTGGNFAVKANPAPSNVSDFVVADMNEDGRADIIRAIPNLFNTKLSNFEILLSKGDGTFGVPEFVPFGLQITQMAIGDINGDKHADLVVGSVDRPGDTTQFVSVFNGSGKGDFFEGQFFGYSFRSDALAIADANGDRRLDVISVDQQFSELHVLLNGPGLVLNTGTKAKLAFQPSPPLFGDINGDGKLETILTQPGTDNAQIYFAPTFQPNTADPFTVVDFSLPNGQLNVTIRVSDVNGDKRADILGIRELAGGNFVPFVQFGNGDGTFAPAVNLLPMGQFNAMELSDLNRDGKLDIVLLQVEARQVQLMAGRGDGTFQPPQILATSPGMGLLTSFLLGDINGDGITDLVFDFSIPSDNRLETYLGKSDGTFTFAKSQLGISDIDSLADLNNDGKADLVESESGNLIIRLSDGQGGFTGGIALAGIENPLFIDANADGKLDILAANNLFGGGLQVRAGRGDGSFDGARAVNMQTPGITVTSVSVADIFGTGQAAVLLTGFDGFVGSELQVYTESARYTLTDNGSASSLGDNPPVIVDLNGDGIDDAITLDRNGKLAYRQGLGLGNFAPAKFDLLAAYRTISAVQTVQGPALAVVPRMDDRVNILRLVDGKFQVTPAFATGQYPVRIGVYDLNGDGRQDLVTADALSDRLTIALQGADGSFKVSNTFATGGLPSPLAFGDFLGKPAILVGNLASGDMSFYRDPVGGSFSSEAEVRYLLGTGFDQFVFDTTGQRQVRTLEPAAGLAVTDVNNDGRPDLVVTLDRLGAVQVLLGTSGGGFTNPSTVLTYPTSAEPTRPLVGDFNGDGKVDFAILMTDTNQAWVYIGRGDGNFNLGQKIAVGNSPVGMALADANQDGKLDLLVGNEFGDLLLLTGRGDGTFSPFVRADQAVPLAVTDLNGNKIADAFVAVQAADQVAVGLRTDPLQKQLSTTTLDDGNNNGDLLSPGAVQFGDFNGDGNQDAVVVASGGNAVLLYAGRGNGLFDQAKPFFVGTTPTDLTIADFNADGILDIATANQGSNDVSILAGKLVNGAWLPRNELRLNAGPAPTTIMAQDFTGDGQLDIVVINVQDGVQRVLRSVGKGFFDDVNLITQTVDPNGISSSTKNPNGQGTVVVGSDGSIRVTDPTTGQNDVIFTPNAITPLIIAGATGMDGSVFFSGNSDGSFSQLDSVGGTLSVSSTQPSALGSDATPSSLQVVSLAGGGFEVYATYEGSSQVFVFTFADGAVSPPPSPPSVPPGVPPGVTPVLPDDGTISVPILPPLDIPGISPPAVSPPTVAGLVAFDAGSSGLVPVLDDTTETGELDLTRVDGVLASLLGALLDGTVNDAFTGSEDLLDDEGEAIPLAGEPDAEPAGAEAVNQFLAGIQEALQRVRLPAAPIDPVELPDEPVPEPEAELGGVGLWLGIPVLSESAESPAPVHSLTLEPTPVTSPILSLDATLPVIHPAYQPCPEEPTQSQAEVDQPSLVTLAWTAATAAAVLLARSDRPRQARLGTVQALSD